ncbi:hypothetical protein MVEN_01400000 [Mycena venus]|uniref:Uncharacterized protein n=1 Tax=Mycena venus TaxID=2733690 RepID=A0A8H6XWE4_9AGAR|nr:hypothetical protein MVEN_01400000 [Mycena venus]
MARLSPSQKTEAQALAKKLFDLEVFAERQSAILRADPAQLAQAYSQYTDAAPPVGYLPPPDQLAAVMEQMERQSLSEPSSFVERIRAVSNAFFLVRTHNMLAAQKDYDMFLEMLRIGSAMRDAHPYQTTDAAAPPPQLPPPVAHQLGIISSGSSELLPTPSANDDLLEPPITLSAHELTHAEIATATRTKVQHADLDAYRNDPDQLRNLVFVTSTGAETLTFRIASVLRTDDDDRCFLYLAHVGEGAEAICYTHADVLAMLSEDSYMLTPN